MRLLWILLTAFCVLVIVTLLLLPIDIEIVGIKWVIHTLFIVGSVRLVYYNNKLTFLRVTAILMLLGALFYWRSDLDLAHWTTRFVVYENKQIKNRTIEFQTRESGEWLEQRIIDRISLIPCVYWKQEIDRATSLKMDTLTWRRVNRKIRRHSSAQQ
jgi:hypothetical protein